ncbi:YceI family protein [Flavobacterium sp.]|uniref:YceI family protein n=1 Tax=Flavobacterium sp. TaxID=239 RepID=UPI003527DBBD
MLKNFKTLALAAFALVAFTTQAQTAKKINIEKSSINWVGKKVTGQHNGTVNLKEGNLVFKDEALVGGKFIVDMTTINTTDLQGEWAQKLNNHLKADDFFGVEKYPTATLQFKKIADKGNNVYTIYADLTIKDITNPVSFDIVIGKNTATTKLTIDRTKFDIKYKSGSFFENLGDKAIYDDFELDINLVF